MRAKGNAWGVVGWSIGNGWLTLLNPVMFNKIGEKYVFVKTKVLSEVIYGELSTLHIFGAINFLSIPMVWALYPE